MEQNKRYLGTVQWFSHNPNGGFGVINSGGKAYFVYSSSIASGKHKSLEEGQRVSFKTFEGQAYPEAFEVTLES